MTRSIAAAVGALITIVTLVGGIFVIDDRYYKTAEAAEYRNRADIDRESGDVDLRLKVLELEIKLNDDTRRGSLLEKQVEQLMNRQNRLIELEQGM